MICRILTMIIMLYASSFLLAQPIEEEEEMLQPFWTGSGLPGQSTFGQGFPTAGRDLNKDGTPDPAFFSDNPANPGGKILIVLDGKNPATRIYDAPLDFVAPNQPTLTLIGFFDIVPGQLRTIVLATKAGKRFKDPIVINPNKNTYWCGDGQRLLGIAEMSQDVCCEVIASDPVSQSVIIYTKDDSAGTTPSRIIYE